MKNDLLFTIYHQLGTHMWVAKQPLNQHGRYVSDKVIDCEASWRKRMEYARKCGANTALVDVAEMLRYPSHPEIWIDGAWSAEKMNGWVRWLKSLGYREVIPSLNFSTAHHLWLGEYSRMVSTPIYYKVCRDLIRDAWEVFDKPRLFHFGMDEEEASLKWLVDKYSNQQVVFRQGELYWHDNLFFIREIEKLGSQAWMAADKIRYCAEEYAKHIPKSALQENWFYGHTFDRDELRKAHMSAIGIDAYEWLEKYGYDQTLGCTNWLSDPVKKLGFTEKTNTNIAATFKYAKGNSISPERLKGIVVMAWSSVTPSGDGAFYSACDQMRDAIAAF